jgi:hypothetical protein
MCGSEQTLDATAQVMVFDRGLPTTNLNGVPNPNQSNVLWADIESLPDTPWLPGDDFTLAGTGAHTVTTIRVWSPYSVGMTLRGGVAGNAIVPISSTYVATLVTYTNGESFQATDQSFRPLYQLDFAVVIPLNGGGTYQFFLDGPPVATNVVGDFAGALLHASNAALSGSPQQGADDVFLFLDTAGVVLTWNSATGAGTYCGCVGWNKTSDANVQVFELAPLAPGAVAVPALSGMGLGGLALLLAAAGFVMMRVRRRE